MGEAFDYVQYHVDRAARLLADAREKHVLVVGCNEGREVSLFTDAGAREVWGIDLIDDVGSAYLREHAHYLQMSAEAMDQPRDRARRTPLCRLFPALALTIRASHE